MTPGAVLFDVGRVLIHPQGEHFRVAARRCGHELSGAAALLALARTVWTGAAQASPVSFWACAAKARAWAAHAGLPEEDGPAIWHALELGDSAADPLWSDLDGQAVPTLVALRSAGLRLAAVSNAEGDLDRDLTRHGIRAYFDTILDSYVEGTAKPDPEIFARAAARLGLPLSSCVFVGDDPYFDVAASLAAGVGKAILLDQHGLRPATWTSPAATCLSEVAGLTRLERWRRGGA